MLNILIIHFFGLLTPGPDFFYVTRMAASNTRRNTLCGVIGISLGIVVWTLAAMLGLSVLFEHLPMLQGMMMIAGGAYLGYLGVQMLRSTGEVAFSDANAEMLNQNTSIKKEIFKGFLINIANAKAVVYFASIMTLVLGNLTHIRQMVLAGGLIVLETFLYFLGLSFIFSHSLAKKWYQQYGLYIDRCAGAIFVLFAIVLIYKGIVLF